MTIEAGALGGAEAAPNGLVGGASGPWTDLAPHPVRRWIARSFDSYVTTGLVFGALAAPWAVFVAGEARFIPFGLLGIVYLLPPVRGLVTAVLNALMLSRVSTTPGKWICGVRIIRKDGAPLSFGLAFKRELDALAAGCAVYIPLISLFAMGSNFFELRNTGATSWDRGRDLRAVQRPNSAGQIALALAAFLVTAVLALGAFIVAQVVWDAAKRGAAR